MKNNDLKNTVVPPLRFLEFQNTEGWEKKQISNLLDYERPDNYIVSDTNYTREGTPVLTANKSFILGYTQEQHGIFKDTPVIIFDDFTIDKKYVDFPFKVKSSAIKILKNIGEHNLKFIYELITLIELDAKEHKRYYISEYQNLFVPCPKIKEQQKIAACLSSLDALITAESQKRDALKGHKKGLMQQLFPAEGETMPQLRFEEWRGTEGWEKKPLKDIFTIFQGFAFSSTDSVPVGTRWLKIADVSIQKMNYEAYSFLPTDYKEKFKNFLVRQGDYVMALTRPILHKELKMAQIDEVFHEALLNQRVGKLVTSHNIDFVYYLLQTSKLISEIEKNIAGSEPPNLSVQQIENITTYIPSKDEQQKIAACLSSLDDLIKAQSEKVDVLKEHKKGLMQQLFPNTNKDVKNG